MTWASVYSESSHRNYREDFCFSIFLLLYEVLCSKITMYSFLNLKKIEHIFTRIILTLACLAQINCPSKL